MILLLLLFILFMSTYIFIYSSFGSKSSLFNKFSVQHCTNDGVVCTMYIHGHNVVSWLFICEQSHVAKDVPLIFDAVFECTLDMINKVIMSHCVFV